ncbi:MAG TPA: MFS transporter [Methylomirabilota bacterium]|nr:MFS transporter [Methylomirabilota bacterium]
MSALGPGRLGALAVGFAILFVGTGVNFAFGILFKPILGELGIGRSTLALAATASLLVNAAGQPVLGALVDRFGPRRVILASMTLMAVGTALVSQVTGSWQFILLYGVVAAVGYTGCGILPVSIHVSRWFPEERGFLSAVVACGFSLGHLAFTQAAARSAAAVGWRQTYALMAAVLAAALGIFALTLRDAPDSASGAPRESDTRRHDPSLEIPAGAPSISRRAALATPAFWALTAGLMGCGFTDFLMTTHLAPYATDLGMTSSVAANAISLWAAANVAGILAAGTVASRIGTRAALVLTYGLRAAALFYLPLVREPWQLYLFAGLFGATFFTTAPLSSTMVGQLFGPAHHGTIFGAANLFHHGAGALGSYAGGLVFDVTGSYRPIFLLGALVVVGSAAVTSLARRPLSAREQSRAHQDNRA